MRVWLLVLVVLAVAWSGCFDEAPVDPATKERDDAKAQASSSAPSTSTDPDAPSAPAPEWRPGDWWQWQITPRDVRAYEATTVVARADANGYEIGWGAVDEGLRSQFFHFIPHGEVSNDIVWEGHHEPIEWFDFPLVDGKTWTGGIWMTDMAFTATAAEVPSPDGPIPGFLVQGSGRDGGVRVDLEWATGVGMFTGMRFYLFNEVPWLDLELVAHGAGRTEPVQVLHGDMTFATFTSLDQAVESTSPPPAAERIQVPEGITHVALGCYLGGPPGYYSYRFADSAQTTYDCEAHVTDEWFGALITYGPIVPGAALSSFVTAGQGSVFTELFLVRAEAVTPA